MNDKLISGVNYDNEIDIIWLKDPSQFTYLREAATLSRNAKRKIKLYDPNLAVYVGYAVYKADGSGLYHRRYWFLRDYDFPIDHKTYAKVSGPVEAVDPTSVHVGRPSTIWHPPK